MEGFIIDKVSNRKYLECLCELLVYKLDVKALEENGFIHISKSDEDKILFNKLKPMSLKNLEGVLEKSMLQVQP